MAQLYSYVQRAYGPAADVEELPVFLVDPKGPGVLLLAHVGGGVQAVVVGTGARPSGLAFTPHGPRQPTGPAAAYRLKRLAAELAAATGYRPPVPWEAKY